MSFEPTVRRARSLNGLLFVCTFMVMATVVLVVLTIEVTGLWQDQKTVEEAASRRAVEVSRLVALQLGAATENMERGEAEKIVRAGLEVAGRETLGATVYDHQGTAVLAVGDTQGAEQPRALLAAQALTRLQTVIDTDGRMAAVPILDASGARAAGVFVSAWNDAFLNELPRARNKMILVVGFCALLMALALLFLFLRHRIAHPLAQLEKSIERITVGDYENEVMQPVGRDEIGRMAEQLETLRCRLGAARSVAQETEFNRAAFANSSAPMLLVDAALVIQNINPACEAMISQNIEVIGSIWPDALGQSLIGASLGTMEGVEEVFAHFDPTGRNATETGKTILWIGTRLISVGLNAVFDLEGEVLGYCVELADRTEEQRNAALFEVLEMGRLRIEFDPQGRMIEVNQNFLSLVKSDDLPSTENLLSRMFAGNLDSDVDGRSFHAQVFEGKIRQGRFLVNSPLQDESFVLDGSFALMYDLRGQVQRAVFLANDSTKQYRTMRQDKTTRLQNAQDQEIILDLFGEAFARLSKGDLEFSLEQDVPQSFEKLRMDFNSAIDALRSALSAIVLNVDAIGMETAEIHSAADDLSLRTEQKAATFDQTATALDALTISVRAAAEGADEASKMAAEAQENARHGGEIARQAMTAMDGIKASSLEISKITNVIDDIAFQTNLLALNAGVEAARAGEAGRGFAVVATEVRALAQRSSDAAREIDTLLKSSGEQVQFGVDLVDRTGTSLASIVTSVSEITSRVSAIAISAREQSGKLVEINTAVTVLDQLAQQNAIVFEKTNTTSQALTAKARTLATAVSHFRLGQPLPAQEAFKDGVPADNALDQPVVFRKHAASGT